MEDKADIERYIRDCIDNSIYFRRFCIMECNIINAFYNHFTGSMASEIVFSRPFTPFGIRISNGVMDVYNGVLCYRVHSEKVPEYRPRVVDEVILGEDEYFVV